MMVGFAFVAKLLFHDSLLAGGPGEQDTRFSSYSVIENSLYLFHTQQKKEGYENKLKDNRAFNSSNGEHGNK